MVPVDAIVYVQRLKTKQSGQVLKTDAAVQTNSALCVSMYYNIVSLITNSNGTQ